MQTQIFPGDDGDVTVMSPDEQSLEIDESLKTRRIHVPSVAPVPVAGFESATFIRWRVIGPPVRLEIAQDGASEPEAVTVTSTGMMHVSPITALSVSLPDAQSQPSAIELILAW